jgi:hypothetical protein
MTGPRDSTRTEPSTITVMVTFFADLRRFLPRGADGPQRYTVPKSATVDDLLAVIGVAPDAELTIALDGEQADRDAPLREGAEVMLLSPMEGGAAAEGEATTIRDGGAAADAEATTTREGGA